MNRDSGQPSGGDDDRGDASGSALDTNQIIAERREKLKALRTAGNAYPNDFVRRDYAREITARYGRLHREALQASPVEVAVAGRIMLKRVMGKASFATIRDMTGDIQIYVTDGDIGKTLHD